MARLDVRLESLLASRALHARHPDEPAYYVDPETRIHVAVQFTGDVAPLRAAGFDAGDVHDNRAVETTTDPNGGEPVIHSAHGAIDIATLERLAHLPNVLSIEEQGRLYLQVDKSIPDIKANSVWSRIGASFHGYTGFGVIIGIIDTGIDFRHTNFINADGTTRIISIWDQTMLAPINPPVAGESAPPAITSGPFMATLGYGVEYVRNAARTALENRGGGGTVRHVDGHGHGTHVAGIAGGNGRQAGGCHGDYHYIGVAPQAEFVIVRLWGLSDGDRGEKLTPPANPPFDGPPQDIVGDAVRYIMNVANTQGKPVVINCSFGAFREVMDGTSNICTTVNGLLTANSAGRAVVWGAGNDGAAAFHAVGTVGAAGSAPLALTFQIFPDDTQERTLAIVYAGSNLEVQVTSPVGGAAGTVPWVTLASSPGSSATANGTIAGGTAGTVQVTNIPNRIGITIKPPVPPAPATPGAPPVKGTNVANSATAPWKIELRNTTATPTQVDAFCTGGSSHDSKSAKFLDHVVTNSTLTHQASGEHSIAVGSYQVGGQLAASSARGPTLDGRAKPDLAAPGVNIISAGIAKDRAGDCANCCCECCQDWYVPNSGTSMAAPHIAGVVALMLHKNPGLTHVQIKDLLRNHADGRPGNAPPADTPGWGAGKVSALNSVSATRMVNTPIPIVLAPDAESAASPLPLAPVEPAWQPSLQRLLDTAWGPLYYDLAQKYFREILTLINTNKRVATAWHRARGPVWTRIALTAWHNPDYTIPLSAGGVPVTESLDRFLTMLKRYASADLRADLERFAPWVDLLREDMTLDDLTLFLGNRPPPEAEPLSLAA